jgi:hypothetical protein
MLSSNLTLDEEDAVQAELKELQTEAVSISIICCIYPSLTSALHVGRNRFNNKSRPSNGTVFRPPYLR